MLLRMLLRLVRKKGLQGGRSNKANDVGITARKTKLVLKRIMKRKKTIFRNSLFLYQELSCSQCNKDSNVGLAKNT